jgi:endogenous inhibitor of DNA gyrase (YacG/DUF329 family)
MPSTTCPICKKPVPDQEANAFYPFCSDRCKLIDLGRWLDGKYMIELRSQQRLAEAMDEEQA